jgi:hypothetical protein
MGAADPTSAYVQSSGAGGQPTQAQIAGIASPDAGSSGTQTASAGAAGTGGSSIGGAPTSALASFNPAGLLGNFTQSIGFGGLGG